MKKVTLFVLIVAAMLLVATVGAITQTPVTTDEKYPMIEASSNPGQEAVDRFPGNPGQEAVDRFPSQQAPLDTTTIISGIGIAGAIASFYRYRRK